MLYNKSYPLAYAQENPSSLGLPFVVSCIALLLILGGTLYKVWELRNGGGTLVAERLGGQRIFPNTPDPVERRILNVVEEMALASGTPVPPVFLMDEEGINAFAAGYSSSDAVIGVTRGCAEKLSRDELQGVIAHEFSHILNGDMRMNIRLIGVLHGILLIGLTGQLLFRILFYSGHGRSRSRSKESGQGLMALFVLALLLVALGFLGTLLGNLIKAAVSRQREYFGRCFRCTIHTQSQGACWSSEENRRIRARFQTAIRSCLRSQPHVFRQGCFRRFHWTVGYASSFGETYTGD